MSEKKLFKQTEIGKIPKDWELKPLTELISHIVDNRGKTVPTSNEGIALIATNCIKEDGLYPVKEKIRFLSRETYDTWFRDHPKPGDIIIVNKGTPGLVCLVPEKVDFCIAQDMVAIRPNETHIYGKYLFAAMRSKNFKFQVDGLNVGTTIPHLKKSVFSKLLIPFPPKEDQIFIGNIYCSLSEKIEINRQVNSTLEAIGQALFKRWFADFEFPDGEGKLYRSSGGEMVETELGEVPKGWRVGSILDCADLLSGGTPKTEIAEYWGGDIPWVSAKDVTDAHGSFVLDTERKITRAGIDNSSAKLLPKNTTVVTARGTVGSYCILSREMAINQTNYGLKAKSGIGDFFIFFSISNLVIQMKQNAYGTIFDTITTKTFKEMKISIPPESIIKSFDDKINSIMSKILHNLEESCNLATIRDALLPKLISGEIRISTNNNLNKENK